MNIITADFNWISLIVIVVTVIGMLRSSSKKQARKPIPQQPDFSIEEETVEVTETSFSEFPEKPVVTPAEENLPGDYYREFPEEYTPETSPICQSSEEEQEEHVQFDIRQAIISSEILRRPQY